MGALCKCFRIGQLLDDLWKTFGQALDDFRVFVSCFVTTRNRQNAIMDSVQVAPTCGSFLIKEYNATLR